MFTLLVSQSYEQQKIPIICIGLDFWHWLKLDYNLLTQVKYKLLADYKLGKPMVYNI